MNTAFTVNIGKHDVAGTICRCCHPLLHAVCGRCLLNASGCGSIRSTPPSLMYLIDSPQALLRARPLTATRRCTQAATNSAAVAHTPDKMATSSHVYRLQRSWHDFTIKCSVLLVGVWNLATHLLNRMYVNYQRTAPCHLFNVVLCLMRCQWTKP